MIIRQRVISEIETALKEIDAEADVPPVKLEYAREEKFGDYACTIAMDKSIRAVYAAGNPELSVPRKFAEAIRDSLLKRNNKTKFFDKIEIAGPGFINITLSMPVLFEYIISAVNDSKIYGQSKTDQKRKIIFEFVSANPTGPLNVVSARSAALGDACCNLLEAIGEEVYREYFVNDFGNQVELLGQSIFLRYLEQEGLRLKFAQKSKTGEYFYKEEAGLPFPAEAYHGDYIIAVMRILFKKYPELKPDEKQFKNFKSLAAKTDIPTNFLEDPDFTASTSRLGQKSTEYFQEMHETDLKQFRVKFDNYFSERSLHEKGAVPVVRDAIKKYIFSKDKKEFFRSTDFGDDQDRVIIREDGRPTYLLADIAYHKTKIERKFSTIVNIWGPDHHGYIKRLSGAMQAMGFPENNFEIKIAQQVNLLENGKPIVMSKRTGKFITMETLLSEIPVDVVRYFFTMRSFESHLDFDFTTARDTSEKNPYYYVAYAHARIRSIFKKAAERKLAAMKKKDLKKESLQILEITPERRELLWLTAIFPEEVREAALNMEPHRLTSYLYRLAGALARFYGPRENKIIEQEKDIAAILLTILNAVSICLKNGLQLLGMEAPERLERTEK